MGRVPSTDRRGEVGETRGSNDQPKASGCSETCLGLAAMSRKRLLNSSAHSTAICARFVLPATEVISVTLKGETFGKEACCGGMPCA
jgi:hypothetical protein